MIVDAGFLISIDRHEQSATDFLAAANRRKRRLHVTEPVIAQVWRGGTRQARLAQFLQTAKRHPLTDGPAIGTLLAKARTSDVVDAHMVVLAVQLGQPILTGDMSDFTTLVASIHRERPRLHEWH